MSSRLKKFNLRIPLMAAPMSIASSVALIKACLHAGVMSCFPTHNAARDTSLENWINQCLTEQSMIRDSGKEPPPFAVNINVSRYKPAHVFEDEVTVCRNANLPIITSNAGNPTELVKRVHDWGGLVIHDATTIEQAERAVAAGVDGLMLVCAGAGGLGGTLSPFAFIPAVRNMFDGIIQLAGGVANGAGIAAAEMLGADMVCMGTRFIATRESGVVDGHKDMLTQVDLADIVWTDRICGVHANFLSPSIKNNGLDPDKLPSLIERKAQLPGGVKPWRDIWSGGHSAALIDSIPTVSDLVNMLEAQYRSAQKSVMNPHIISET